MERRPQLSLHRREQDSDLVRMASDAHAVMAVFQTRLAERDLADLAPPYCRGQHASLALVRCGAVLPDVRGTFATIASSRSFRSTVSGRISNAIGLIMGYI